MTNKQENMVLALIGSDPDGLKPIEIHKLLFMLGKLDPASDIYEFIPYKMGCYSPTLSRDLQRLEVKGYLKKGYDSYGKSFWRLTVDGETRSFASRQSGRRVVQFRRMYPLRGKDLVIDVYRRYPYSAINSTISEILLRDDLDAIKRIMQARPVEKVALASIGYEGRTIENYFNALITSGIDVLCDVRKNPISRKYGFSRSVLCELCEGCGIEYRHYPQLGIPSWERQALNCQADYDSLFVKYEREILPRVQREIAEISDMVKQGRGVALTCFEANPAQCHRTKVLNAITSRISVFAELI
jgi:hypothetical protein